MYRLRIARLGPLPAFLAMLMMIGGLAVVCAEEDGKAAPELIVNGDFEQQLDGWQPLWTRTPGGTAAVVGDRVRQGRYAARIEHTGSEDWSFGQGKRLPVRPGEIYELSGWVWVEGEGSATLGVVLRDSRQQVLDWAYRGQSVRRTNEWGRVVCQLLIPPGGDSIEARWIGRGPAVVWLDDVSLRRTGSLDQLRRQLPESLTASNSRLEVTLRTDAAALSVVDSRTNRCWQQRPSKRCVVLGAEPLAGGNGFRLELLDSSQMLRFQTTMHLEDDRPELLMELAAQGPMSGPLAFPTPFEVSPGQFLIMPVNEGISYPVGDRSLPEMNYHLYGGHGLCMGWWGATAGEDGLMALVETPDDAAVRVPRIDGLLHQQPEWIPQKGQFGPTRRIRYVFFDNGGYVAMCKRYRQYAGETRLLKTLAEKRAANAHVDRLVGAVNVWCWDRDPVTWCRRLQAAGIEQILWSNRSTPEQIEQMNALGVLTSRYDIYQDVMDPANFPKLRGVHSDWPTEAWPDDLMIAADGQWVRGWPVRGKDDQWYPCGVLCDRRAVDYARKRIVEELKTHPYRCRFIDTTTASPWRECYHPDHPLTRSESRYWKMELLRLVSEQCGLVTGSETGHEAAVPYLHYFEGMMSLGPYRVPDAGRDMMRLWDEVPERVAKFQTGHYYRLPLWELVYHDCVVSYWYWGDYNNKLPSLWDRRDLLNALYGTPPMFMFNRAVWDQYQDRFVQSYKAATPVARATGYVEMIEHRWLTNDHTVQQTRFANGVTVTANFGEKPFAMPDGVQIAPLAYRAEGLPDNHSGR